MGAVSSRLPWASRPETIDFLVLGLDAAGKTTLLYSLRAGEVKMTIPTIGLYVETLEFRPGNKLVTMTCWDVGGRSNIRALWRHFWRGKDVLIYVVNSRDLDRMQDARDNLQSLLQEPELQGIPLLVYANKQDLPGALSADEVADKLGLHALRGRRWHITASIVPTGTGVYEGLEWCVAEVKRARAAKSRELSPETAPTLLQSKKAEADKDHGGHDREKTSKNGLDLGRTKLAGLLNSKLFPPFA
eukprot:TRINITY_DN4425_c0_g1_i4.p1 TRINITY_DN4425_c0_g1~~TRINITY_DN4425_c0_g1_i4.p1  ORF type:complete len:245 (+),score=37.60 TRINITY_DN4425_c0_g1_i4:527-1261(+)